MSYSHEYYLKNRERIIQKNLRYDRAHPEKIRAKTKRLYWKNREKVLQIAHKNYLKRKEKFEKEYGTMSRNIRNERVQEYLSDPAYYKEKLVGKVSSEKLEISLFYLDNPSETLFSTGRKYHKGKERIRQIVAQTLFQVARLAQKKEINKKSPLDRSTNKQGRTLTQVEFDRIKELLYQGESTKDIYEITGRVLNVISNVAKANDLTDYLRISREQSAKYASSMPYEPVKELPQGTQVSFHHPLPNFPAPHRQALADAIDAFIEVEVQIRLKEKLQKLLNE